MSLHDRKQWLLAYDICQPKRLRRVHAYLLKRGWPLQYSVFALEMSEHDLRDMLDDLVHLIDIDCDDVRVYRLPKRCTVWTVGRQSHPDGVEVNASMLLKLMSRNPSGSASTNPPAKADATSGFQSFFRPKRSGTQPRNRGD